MCLASIIFKICYFYKEILLPSRHTCRTDKTIHDNYVMYFRDSMKNCIVLHITNGTSASFTRFR